MKNIKILEKLVEKTEVIINKHSPMLNFGVKEKAAREIVDELFNVHGYEIEKRLDRLETHFYGMPKCSLCGRKSRFQSGETRTGRIASWCSKSCQKKYRITK